MDTMGAQLENATSDNLEFDRILSHLSPTLQLKRHIFDKFSSNELP